MRSTQAPEAEASGPAPVCRICNHPGVLRPWEGIECQACGSVSAAWIPSNGELAEFYRGFGGSYHGGGRERGAVGRQQRYARTYLRLIRRFRRHGSVLDIGSANNPLPGYLAAEGYEVAVSDLERPEGLEDGIRFVPARLGDPSGFVGEAGAESFDLVTGFAVIEHVRDPREWIEMLVALLRPSGLIVLTTPEIGRFPDRNAPGRSRWFCPPEHLHLISRGGMRRLFESRGCTLLHAGRVELNPLRWMARYGLLTAEGFVGWGLRMVMPRTWRRVRDRRLALGQGIASFVFRKGREK